MNYIDHALPPQRRHWALAVLALLRERPMHPYEMRRLIRDRHKEERLLIKPGSLYHAITWLKKQSLIEPVEKTREGKRPERTIYRILNAGEKTLLSWLPQMLAQPLREPSSFVVALDHAVHLQPADVARSFEQRAQVLEQRIKEMDYTLNVLTTKIGRINLLELDFERALCQAELAWLQKLIPELRSGAFSWNIQEILSYLRSVSGKNIKTPRNAHK